jgi:type IV secretion system protein VirB4
MHEVSPGFMLCKDGSVIVGYSYSPIDIETTTPSEERAYNEYFEKALKEFDGYVNMWTTVHRKEWNVYSDKVMPDEYSQVVADAWSESFHSSPIFKNNHYVFLQIKAFGSLSDEFSKDISQSLNSGKGFASSIYSGLKRAFSYKDRLFSDIAEINLLIEKAEKYALSFSTGASFMNLQRLNGSDLIGALDQYVSPTSKGKPVRFGSNTFVDTRIGDSVINFNSNYLEFEGGSKSKYAVILSAKEFPVGSEGQLNAIAFKPYEVTISQAMMFWDYNKSESYVKSYRNFYEQGRKSFLVSIKEAIAKEPLDQLDNEKVIDFEDSDIAMSTLSQLRIAGMYNLTLVIYGDTPEQAVANSEDAIETLKSVGMLVFRERMHSLGSFAATMPGQYQEALRWYFFFGANYSDMMLFFGPHSGDHINMHLTEELGYIHNSLCVFRNRFFSPRHFNFHWGKLGHTLAIGQSRGGKSVLMNFLWTMYRQYNNTQIFIFDKDKTCRIPVLMQGGVVLEPSSSDVKINPFSLVNQKGGVGFLVSWLEILITGRGRQMSAQDHNDLWSAVETASKSVGVGVLKLETLMSFLPKDLALELSAWVGQGQYAHYFDNIDDNFSMANIMSMDMGRMFKDNPTAAIAFMEYAFFRIELRLDGRPTIIYIEELWFPIQHPLFQKKLDDWIRTSGKKNVIIMMTTQSLKEIVDSGVANLLLDNVPTKIFIPNREANAEMSKRLYREFGLTELEIDELATLRPNHEYMIKQPDSKVIVQARFDKKILAIVRSDQFAQNKFDQCTNDGKTDKRSYYLDMISS